MFIDSHCHFNFDCFKTEQDHLLSALSDANINKLVIPGTDAKRWPQIIDLVEQNIVLKEHKNKLYFALGVHPHFLTDFENDHLSQLKALLVKSLKQSDNRCVALGEIGLDKLIETDLATQESVFLAQLAIAESLQLPVILHVVKTQSRVLQLLKETKFSYGGVYHAFSGSEEIANEFIKLGFKLGIGGVITYPNANKTRNAVSQLPLTSIVLETDAPDMPVYQQLTPHNSPLHLKTIFDSLCQIRKESPKVVAQQIYENTKGIFSIIND
ncbi:TatD family hydrolase [uncultured Psychromonas sp.]|uniref:TatD family hydrolase n=1 Tax=uncultured Psychromonas sp. TaxID=173974 RepID=UPI00262280A7|nr:TatD family hydrolase [uncultured Psychromonas sp.]